VFVRAPERVAYSEMKKYIAARSEKVVSIIGEVIPCGHEADSLVNN
jgi:hypothetical protein